MPLSYPKRFCSALLISMVVSNASVCLAYSIDQAIHRYALIIGSNSGGSGRSKLRFANQDAEAFVSVLNELGGVTSKDTVLIKDATKSKIEDGLKVLQSKLAMSSSTSERNEVILYYSGHSDESGLRLENEIYPYKQLKSLLTTLPGQVKILVLDSCASGQLAMMKGSAKRPAFLMDASNKTSGHAIITSTSSTEAAQESGSIGGSIFTHYFLSGLRGAADLNSDGKVTLNEAYQYAYAETLGRTEKTMSGAQHPTYDFQLAGTGDVVLTDLRQASATLHFDSTEQGRYFIRGAANGELIAEINKPTGKPIDFGLPPGAYKIVHDKSRGVIHESSFALAANDHKDVRQFSYTPSSVQSNATRGPREYTHRAAVIGLEWFGPEFDSPTNESHNFSLDVLAGHSAKLDGVATGMIGHRVDDDANGAMIELGFNEVGGSFNGFQSALLKNEIGGDFKGFQSGGYNHVKGTMKGAQNGFYNRLESKSQGAQMGLVNYTSSDIQGAQIGLANVGKTIDGAQIGLANVAEHTNGAQVGLVNIDHSAAPVQIGLVNISNNENTIPIGLISIVKGGRKYLDLWGDEIGIVHASFRMGSKYVYTIYDIGHQEKPGARDIYGFGIGGTYEFDNGFVSAETIKHQIFGTDYLSVQRHQLLLGYKFTNTDSIYIGPAYSGYYGNIKKQASPFNSRVKDSNLTGSWFGGTLGYRRSL